MIYFLQVQPGYVSEKCDSSIGKRITAVTYLADKYTEKLGVDCRLAAGQIQGCKTPLVVKVGVKRERTEE